MSHLSVLTQRTAICRLDPDERIPSWVQNDELTALVRTPDEFSIVCDECSVPEYIKVEKDWRILKVQGPLEFTQVGILASITVPLTQAGVSIFAMSTFDTDYVLVKESSLALAVDTLRNAGHVVDNV